MATINKDIEVLHRVNMTKEYTLFVSDETGKPIEEKRLTDDEMTELTKQGISQYHVWEIDETAINKQTYPY